MKPKDKILNMLNQADGVVSGETLSAELGVSRVSVWKHIRGLNQSGLAIQSSPKGYRLKRDPDTLQPWAFDGRQDRIHFFPETSSTMDEATRLAREGCPTFTVAVAQRQTHGRGRLQRAWLSGEGGLFFTIVVRPEIALMQAGLVNLAAAIDMAAVLRAVYDVDARLKWPNDILVKGRKICGVLSQMEAEGDQVAYLNIGIGLNVNNVPETEAPIAISMKNLLGKTTPRREVLTAFLDVFEKRMSAFEPDGVIEQWISNNVTLGQNVRVLTINDRVDGTAVGIDPLGGLVLVLADGSKRTVMVGDCFHR